MAMSWCRRYDLIGHSVRLCCNCFSFVTYPVFLIELRDLPVAAHFLQQRSNAVVRKELAAHLHQQTALLTGYADFLQRNARALLTLCQDRPLLPGASPTAETTITGARKL